MSDELEKWDEKKFEIYKTSKLAELQPYRAICLLASGYTPKETCAHLGISERCLQRWMKSDDFSKNLKFAIGVCFRATLAKASEYSSRALQILTEMIEDTDCPYRTRLDAIKTLFGLLTSANVQNSEENKESFETGEQIKTLHQFSTVKTLIGQERQVTLPQVKETVVVENKEIWTKLFPTEPFPDNENLRKDYDDRFG